nr:MFS transporter [Acinetobacter sp. MB5]
MPNIYVLLFSLYWAQGLPVGFMTHALPVLLRAEGVSLAKIGGFGLLMMPWAIKALWAPWVDQWGHFRRWILVTQFLSIIFLVVLAKFPLSVLHQPSQLYVFFILLFLLNSAGATQDIATDGLAVKLLKQQQQHWGNSLQVMGSRLGFIVGGGAMLWAVGDFGWQSSFMCLAGLVLLNTIPMVLYRDQSPNSIHHIAKVDQINWRTYLPYFLDQKEIRAWLLVLLTFKVADGLFGPMSKTIMVDLGLSLLQIGFYISILGAVSALLGSLVAAWILRVWSRNRALYWFSVFKVLSLLGMAWLAMQLQTFNSVSHLTIYVLHAFEEFCSAMLLVVMLTLIMQYCRPQFAATDFTLQVSIMALVSGISYVFGGFLTENMGYWHMSILVLFIVFINMFFIYKWGTRYSKN